MTETSDYGRMIAELSASFDRQAELTKGWMTTIQQEQVRQAAAQDTMSKALADIRVEMARQSGYGQGAGEGRKDTRDNIMPIISYLITFIIGGGLSFLASFLAGVRK